MTNTMMEDSLATALAQEESNDQPEACAVGGPALRLPGLCLASPHGPCCDGAAMEQEAANEVQRSISIPPLPPARRSWIEELEAFLTRVTAP